MYSHICKLPLITLEMRIAPFQGSTRQLNKRIILKFEVGAKLFLEEPCWIKFFPKTLFLIPVTKNKTVKMCLFFRLDKKLSVRGKHPILNSWHATVILKHLSSTVAAEIDTILSCCHLANILMWQTCTYAFVPTRNVFKEVMLHPRRALYSVTTARGILCESSSTATKSNILSDHSLWYI